MEINKKLKYPGQRKKIYSNVSIFFLSPIRFFKVKSDFTKLVIEKRWTLNFFQNMPHWKVIGEFKFCHNFDMNCRKYTFDSTFYLQKDVLSCSNDIFSFQMTEQKFNIKKEKKRKKKLTFV